MVWIPRLLGVTFFIFVVIFVGWSYEFPFFLVSSPKKPLCSSVSDGNQKHSKKRGLGRLLFVRSAHYGYFRDWIEPMLEALSSSFDIATVTKEDLLAHVATLTFGDVVAQVFFHSNFEYFATNASQWVLQTEDAWIRGQGLKALWLEHPVTIVDFGYANVEQFWKPLAATNATAFVNRSVVWIPIISPPSLPLRTEKRFICSVGIPSIERRKIIWENLTRELSKTGRVSLLHVVSGFGDDRNYDWQHCSIVVYVRSFENAPCMSRMRTDLAWLWGMTVVSESSQFADEQEYAGTAKFYNYSELVQGVLSELDHPRSPETEKNLFLMRKEVQARRRKAFDQNIRMLIESTKSTDDD